MVVSRIYEKTNVIPRISLEVIERMRKIAQWYSFNCSLEEFKQQVKIKSYLKSLGNEIPIIYIDKTGKVLGIDVTNNLDRFKDIITYGTEPEVDGLTNAHILFKPHN